MRVLLVESDAANELSIEHMLKSDSIKVTVANLGNEGLDLGKLHGYDIILLNVSLPNMSGFDVLRGLRAARVKTPILVVFGFNAIEDKLKHLGFVPSGYLLKPIHKDELLARVHALVHHSRRRVHSIVSAGDLIINLEKKAVEVAGAQVHLTGKEYQLLELLALRKGTTLTKEMLLNHLYGGVDEPDLKIIDVFVCKLRKKLASAGDGASYIETVWGRGYMLRGPTDGEAKISA